MRKQDSKEFAKDTKMAEQLRNSLATTSAMLLLVVISIATCKKTTHTAITPSKIEQPTIERFGETN